MQSALLSRWRFLPWAALLFVTALPLLPSLGSTLFADDYLHIERLRDLESGSLDQALRSWVLKGSDAGAWWADPDLAIQYFRPLVSLSFLIDHAIWGMTPFGYHLTNLLLHLATTLLCYLIARRIFAYGLGGTRSSSGCWSDSQGEVAAWGTAALFGLHPCHTEAILWVSGRTDLIAGLLFAAAFAAYLASTNRWPAANSGQESHGGNPVLQAASLFFFATSLLAKEMAITFPAIVLLYNLYYRRAEPLGRKLAFPVAAGIVGMVYIGLRIAFFGGFHPPPHPFAHGFGDPDMLQNIGMGFFLYLADLVLFIPPDPVVTLPFWLRYWPLFGILSIVTVAVLFSTYRDAKEKQARQFGLLWMLVSLLPVLMVSVGERFLYLPSMGYCLLVGAKLLPKKSEGYSGSEWREMGVVFLIVLAVALGKNLVFQGIAQKSRLAIDDAVAALEANPEARSLFVADLPAASALAFPHAVRLAFPRRGLNVEVLSIAPQFLWSSSSFKSKVSWSHRGKLLFEATGDDAYLESYIERAYTGERPPLQEGERLQTPHYQVEILKLPEGRLRAFAVEFGKEVLPNAVFLRGEGFRLRELGLPEADDLRRAP